MADTFTVADLTALLKRVYKVDGFESYNANAPEAYRKFLEQATKRRLALSRYDHAMKILDHKD